MVKERIAEGGFGFVDLVSGSETIMYISKLFNR